MNDSQPQISKKNPLKKLKQILLQDDRNRINQLQEEVEKLKEQIHDRDRLIETIDPILTDLLDRKIHESREEMAESLAPVMGEAIRKQVENSKEDVVDALYPVIGRMISKAISEAMKNLVENINKNINQTLDIKLWFKRLKARFFGVSAGEMVVAEHVPFQIFELFLIEKKSGLLISYYSTEKENREDDAHVMGSMLTAIKMYVEDAFSGSKDGELKEIEYSDRTIRIESGRYTYLAVVFLGVPNSDFDVALQSYHHKIHNRFYKRLREYSGDNAGFKGTEKIFKEFIRKQSKILPV